MTDEATAPSDAQVKRFGFLSPMLDSALSEMREFSKKKQDGIVGEMKIKILNRLLTEIKEILANEESVAYLDLLSEEQLPQNSDAVLVLGQFRAAMDNFSKRHHRTVGYTSIWATQEWIAENADYEDEDDFDE
ncbi:MAG: hypothetical protein CVT59_08345 [Actinobacteria bacterium HGW-Actinobacteria-1]|nr:MAG: hypothetical protein CVT59_08345 [Actinobacteria bacterium HGW-Actinobacteria-1]